MRNVSLSAGKAHLLLAYSTVILCYFSYSLCILLPVGLTSYTNIVCNELLVCQLCMYVQASDIMHQTVTDVTCHMPVVNTSSCTAMQCHQAGTIHTTDVICATGTGQMALDGL